MSNTRDREHLRRDALKILIECEAQVRTERSTFQEIDSEGIVVGRLPRYRTVSSARSTEKVERLVAFRRAAPPVGEGAPGGASVRMDFHAAPPHQEGAEMGDGVVQGGWLTRFVAHIAMHATTIIATVGAIVAWICVVPYGVIAGDDFVVRISAIGIAALPFVALTVGTAVRPWGRRVLKR